MTPSRILERANMPIDAAPFGPQLAAERDNQATSNAAPNQPDQPAQDGSAEDTFWQRAEHVPFKKRGLLLAAVVAVPAMAAPGDFGALPGDAAQSGNDFATRQIVEAALPFERPGQSFPGSAFYYLGDPPDDALLALPTTDAFDTGAEGARKLGSAIDAGPPASPFFSSTSGSGHLRALDCMAQAIWYEAASESTAGQRAVAQVVLNRVSHPSWPGSVCGVVYEGSQRRTGCQFSFTCDGSLSRRARGSSWDSARKIASDALSGSVYAPIGHATHYHALWVSPYWASSLDHVGTIGAHRFYRNRGITGEKSAFSGRYAGVEPLVRGGTSAAAPLAPALSSGRDPEIASEPVAAASQEAVQAAATPRAPASSQATTQSRYTDRALEGSGKVKSDFSNAGKWKSAPGTTPPGERRPDAPMD